MSDSKFGTWEEAVSWLISQPDKQELVQACYYDQPLKCAAERYWRSQEWQAIKEFLPHQGRQALDLGAGNGISSYALAKEGWQVKALEPDPSELVGGGAIRQLVNQTQLSIEVVQDFGESLPFKETSFDLVFARQVLHHAQDLQQLFKETYRVLKPGGVLIAVRDHVISSQQELSKFLDSHPLHKLYGGENAYLLKEYVRAMKLARLSVDKVIAPFDSVINYTPLTDETLKVELKKKFNQIPGGKIGSKLLLSNLCFPLFLQLLSQIDRRPGRLFSFICHKPKD